jgi:hypothetical protein
MKTRTARVLLIAASLLLRVAMLRGEWASVQASKRERLTMADVFCLWLLQFCCFSKLQSQLEKPAPRDQLQRKCQRSGSNRYASLRRLNIGSLIIAILYINRCTCRLRFVRSNQMIVII